MTKTLPELGLVVAGQSQHPLFIPVQENPSSVAIVNTR